jgi:hypothetical protein
MTAFTAFPNHLTCPDEDDSETDDEDKEDESRFGGGRFELIASSPLSSHFFFHCAYF